MRSCHTLCKLVGMILIKYIFPSKGIKVDTFYISGYTTVWITDFTILMHSKKKIELKKYNFKHSLATILRYNKVTEMHMLVISKTKYEITSALHLIDMTSLSQISV